ncbi:MAG: GNAT family N-acetyltransferase [Dehalococcoidales bacterium]
MPTIRPARHKDIVRILALYDELVIVRSDVERTCQPSRAEYESILDRIQSVPGFQLLVIEDDGQVVGLMELLIMPNLSHNALPWALIEGLIIDSRYRRKGLGGTLVRYAIDKAREAGCYKIELSSNKKRFEAHAFYRSLGFEDAALGFRFYF